jgi:hypothetical protein
MHIIPAQAPGLDALHYFIGSLPPGSLANMRDATQLAMQLS